MNVPLTPIRITRYAQAQFPHRTAVVCGEQRFTYREFAARVAQLAGGLQRLGVEAGDRVAILSLNCHRFLESYYAIPEVGAICLPLNTRLAPAELAYILSDAQPSVLLVEKAYLELIRAILASHPQLVKLVLLDGPGNDTDSSGDAVADYESLLQAAPPFQRDLMSIDENAVAEIFYTSGTTSKPKGVMLSHRNVYLHALNHCMTFDPTALTTHLHTIPMFHVNGWGCVQYVLIGAKHVMVRHFKPEDVFRLVQQEAVTSMALVPTMAGALVNSPERSHYDLASLKRIRVGGASPAPSVLREIEQKLGGTAFNAYGLTECSPSLTSSTVKAGMAREGEERYRRQAMSGYPITGTTVRIVDVYGQEAEHDGVTVGEVLARSDGVMTGYWNDPRATADVLHDGWLSTGDMGTIDEEGYLMIVDRKKDIIISGGENISSVELENTILSHPAVSEVAVVAVADDRWGERPKAFVVLLAGESATEEELIAHCRSQLAHYKAPARVEFVASLPKTGTGKILKRALREQG